MNPPAADTSPAPTPGFSVRTATPEEEFFLAMADDAYKQSIPRLNDALNRLVTLSSALAGGSLVFLKDEVCAPWFRVAAAALFFVALAAAAIGSIPSTKTVSSEAASIRAAFTAAADEKEWWVRAATGLILAGLLAAIAGAFARVWWA